MGIRKMRRSMKKAQGIPLRTGPAKASDGSEKGPARTMSHEEMRQAKRRARKAAAAAAQDSVLAETKAA